MTPDEYRRRYAHLAASLHDVESAFAAGVDPEKREAFLARVGLSLTARAKWACATCDAVQEAGGQRRPECPERVTEGEVTP